MSQTRAALFTLTIVMLARTQVLVALADTSYSAGIQTEIRAQDPRLNARTTLHESRISVGALLEKVGSKFKIDITAGDRDGAGNVEICVFAKDISVAELMDCIWSLVSYKGAQWTWKREGNDGAYAYTLERPLRARGLADRLKAEMQAAIETEVEAMTALAMMTPEQRAKEIGPVVKRVLDGDHALAEGYLKGDRKWRGLATMAEVLTPDERRSLLRGGGDVQVDVEKLSPAGKAFVHSVWEGSRAQRRRSDGTTEPVPEPRHITFASHGGLPTKMVPFLMIYMEGIGGYAYAGGTPSEVAAKGKLRKLWLQEGDLTDSRLTKGRFSQLKSPLQPNPGDTQEDLILRQIADCAPFPIIARLAPNGHGVDGVGYEQPYGKDMSEWLNGDFDNFFQWKWRNNTMLVTNPAWFLQEEQVVPWKVLSNLRKERDPATGHLPLEAICAAASRLEWDQMLGLRPQFQVLYEAASFHDMLAALHAKPLLLKRLRDPRGIPLKEALPLIRGVNDWHLDDVLAGGNVVAVRIASSTPGRATKWDVELLDRDGKVVNSRGFVDIGYSVEEQQAKQKGAGGQ